MKRHIGQIGLPVPMTFTYKRSPLSNFQQSEHESAAGRCRGTIERRCLGW